MIDLGDLDESDGHDDSHTGDGETIRRGKRDPRAVPSIAVFDVFLGQPGQRDAAGDDRELVEEAESTAGDLGNNHDERPMPQIERVGDVAEILNRRPGEERPRRTHRLGMRRQHRSCAEDRQQGPITRERGRIGEGECRPEDGSESEPGESRSTPGRQMPDVGKSVVPGTGSDQQNSQQAANAQLPYPCGGDEVGA